MMNYKIEVSSIWEPGQRKDKKGNPHQEDNLFPPHGGANSDRDRVFVLCDGMGGLDAGEVASDIVCNAMGSSLLSIASQRPFVCTAADIENAVEQAYDALDEAVEENRGSSKMGTTMTCLVLHDKGVLIAHMGDSRVYHVRPGADAASTTILFQTHDHSLVNDLVAIGEITAEEARSHPRRNVVTRALQPGIDNRCRPDITPNITDVRADDWFMLCSDGILESMTDDTIRFLFSHKTGEIENKTRVIRQATQTNQDNHTATLVHILECNEEEVPTTEDDEVDNTEDSSPRPRSLWARLFGRD
ncbi:MAG: serine/threonine-protein phosphatase [Bacteroidales bacterium]|nr:serine/threonine-protein phosphatase [Bacteroidales bacterium]